LRIWVIGNQIPDGNWDAGVRIVRSASGLTATCGPVGHRRSPMVAVEGSIDDGVEHP
jgi:hypothetical protein